MSLRIRDTAPDFAADTTTGPIRFHDWIGNDRASTRRYIDGENPTIS